MHLKLSDEPVCPLLTGLPGSGKSTELRKFVHELEQSDVLPTLIDADKQIDLTNPIDVLDVVAVVVHNIGLRVLETEGVGTLLRPLGTCLGSGRGYAIRRST